MAIVTRFENGKNVERLGSNTSGMSQFRMKLPVEELEIGMRVDELDKPWLESRFLFQGFIIETEADLRALREECDQVFVTVTRKMSGRTNQNRAQPKAQTTAKVYEWPVGQIRS